MMTERIQDLLKAVREGSSGDIWEAARELNTITNDLVVILIALLNAEQPDTRAAAAYVLGCGRLGAARGPLEGKLDQAEEQSFVRGQAAEALGSLQARESVDVLIKHLGDASAEVAYWCTFALGQIGDLRAVPALLQLAERVGERCHEQHSLRDEALDAVAAIIGLASTAPAQTSESGSAPDTRAGG